MADGLDVRGMAFSLAAHDVSSLAADELASVVLESQVLVNAALAYASAVLEEFDPPGDHRPRPWLHLPGL